MAKTFKQLQDEWYGKLKNSGFKDVEDRMGRLITWESHHTAKEHDRRFDVMKPSTKQAQHLTMLFQRQEYYRLAGQFLHENKFDNKMEKGIWEMHCEGIGMPHMQKKYRLSDHGTRDIVHKLVRQMKAMYIK